MNLSCYVLFIYQVGDEIVRVNGFTIAEAIHEEVLNLIKTYNQIELKVTSKSPLKSLYRGENYQKS